MLPKMLFLIKCFQTLPKAQLSIPLTATRNSQLCPGVKLNCCLSFSGFPSTGPLPPPLCTGTGQRLPLWGWGLGGGPGFEAFPCQATRASAHQAHSPPRASLWFPTQESSSALKQSCGHALGRVRIKNTEAARLLRAPGPAQLSLPFASSS